MSKVHRTLSVLTAAALLGLASCQVPLEQPGSANPGAGKAKFSFTVQETQASASLSARSALPTGLKSLLLSLEDSTGGPVFDQEEIDLVPFGSDYVSVSLDLPVGTYSITEFLILDLEGEVQYATPVTGSELAEFVEHPLPVGFTISSSVGTTVNLEVLEVTEETDPEDLGYVVFDPVVVTPPFDFTFQVLGRQPSGETAPIRFFYEKRGVKNRTTGYSVGGSSFLRPEGVYEFSDGSYNWTTANPVEFFELQVGSWGYKSSPLNTYTVEELSPFRDLTPMKEVVLEPELAQVVMTRDGTTEAGLAKYRVRLATSQFLEEAMADFGGTAEDDYSFTVGFSLYALTENGSPYVSYPHWTTKRISANGPQAAGQSPFVFVPYDSTVAQAFDAYKTLEAELVLKDQEALDIVLDSGREKMVQVCVEVLALKDDGNQVIDGSEQFLGFRTSILKVASEHLLIQP